MMDGAWGDGDFLTGVGEEDLPKETLGNGGADADTTWAGFFTAAEGPSGSS